MPAKNESAITYLEGLRSQDEWIRTTAIETLTEMNARESGEPIAKLLRDASPAVRGIAAESLGKLGYTAALSDLLKLA